MVQATLFLFVDAAKVEGGGKQEEEEELNVFRGKVNISPMICAKDLTCVSSGPPMTVVLSGIESCKYSFNTSLRKVDRQLQENS
jgi:hypothetical protein